LVAKSPGRMPARPERIGKPSRSGGGSWAKRIAPAEDFPACDRGFHSGWANRLSVDRKTRLRQKGPDGAGLSTVLAGLFVATDTGMATPPLRPSFWSLERVRWRCRILPIAALFDQLQLCDVVGAQQRPRKGMSQHGVNTDGCRGDLMSLQPKAGASVPCQIAPRCKEEIMRISVLRVVAITSCCAATLSAGGSQAGVIAPLGLREAADDLALTETVQFRFGGRRYCWYDAGWRGAGWYWCGYRLRRGLGWGGPLGWHGWRRPGHRQIVRPPRPGRPGIHRPVARPSRPGRPGIQRPRPLPATTR
jgi:hypothetical protein